MTSAGRWAILLVVVLVVLSVVATALLLWSLSGGSSWQKGGVLHLKITGAVPELSPHDSVSRALGRETLDLRDILDALEKSRGDSSISGLLLEVSDAGLGWAQAEEVRAAIARFRGSKKPTWAFLETAGEFQGGNGAYMLASACEKVFVAPPGDVALTGLRVETPFVRGLLDKLGVVPQFGQRKEFKNAVNTYTEKDYTPAHRQATVELIESLFDELVDAVVQGRGLTPARVRDLISGGPYTAPEALELGLVDELIYRDEVIDRLEKASGSDKPLVSIAPYLRSGRPHDSGRKKIAVVYAVGGVSRGSGGSGPFGGDVMGSETTSKALRVAREDDDVAAVVLRVDSPGGSYVASDIIRREVELTKKAKPVIVSMGNVAASGGYFVAMDANRIVADAGTITGSIGVFAGKLVTRGLWEEKLGVHFGSLQQGENADFWSSQDVYDERGWERMNAMLDRIYSDFTKKAAAGRGLPLEQLEPLAHGRVWSGRDALERKLVDQIGGLHDAIEVARKEGKIGDRAAFRVIVLPRPASPLESFFGGGGDDDETSVLPAEAREALRALSLLGPAAPERVLLNPAIPTVR
jgi:protease-4